MAGPAQTQAPIGGERRVDQRGAETPFIHYTPRAVTLAPDGRFVVAWTTPSPARPEVAARRFDAAGAPLGPEFLVSSSTVEREVEPSIASDEAGNFTVVWRSLRADNTTRGIFVQRFDAGGARRGAELQVSETAFEPQHPAIAMAPGGDFVVAWADLGGIFARRLDASGAPVGGQIRVDPPPSFTADSPSVDMDGAGNFVVVWADNVRVLGQRFAADGSPQGTRLRMNPVFPPTPNRPRVARRRDGPFVVAWSAPDDIVARQFDAGGAPVGSEIFVAEARVLFRDTAPDVDVDADGDFVVTWQSEQADGSEVAVLARRFDPTGAGGPPFRVNTYTTGSQMWPSLAGDQAGNFVVTWFSSQDGPSGAFAQRYAGGLMPVALSVDPAASPTSDGNGVLEAGETVVVAPSWLNANATAQTFSGTASAWGGPGAPGNPTYSLADAAAAYGTVSNRATASCAAAGDCYALGLTVPTARPAAHWDGTFRETIAPASLGAARPWTLHVGESFTDVSRTSSFYRFVEALLHHGITTGCASTGYCPKEAATREQVAVFALVAKEGSGYMPAACGAPMFSDVPAASGFCPWIEELARRNVVAGCGGGRFCPGAAVSREQMAVIVLRAREPALVPPACGAPLFSDVPASSSFCPWIEELARRGVVSGCGGGRYCPTAPVSREQMAVFLSVTFGRALYGP